MSLSELQEYIDSVKRGETILIEHSSVDPIHVVFRNLFGVAELYNASILVIDILDTLFLIKRNLEVLEEDVKFMNSIDVIKGGGAIRIGNVLEEFDPYGDPQVYMTEFLRILRRYYEKKGFTVTFLLGIEKLVNLDQVNASVFPLYLGNVIENFLGHRNRVAVYFVNKDLALPGFLAHLEEASTRVVQIKHEKGVMIVKIEKSPKPEEHGKEFRVPLEALGRFKSG